MSVSTHFTRNFLNSSHTPLEKIKASIVSKPEKKILKLWAQQEELEDNTQPEKATKQLAIVTHEFVVGNPMMGPIGCDNLGDPFCFVGYTTAINQPFNYLTDISLSIQTGVLQGTYNIPFENKLKQFEKEYFSSFIGTRIVGIIDSAPSFGEVKEYRITQNIFPCDTSINAHYGYVEHFTSTSDKVPAMEQVLVDLRNEFDRYQQGNTPTCFHAPSSGLTDGQKLGIGLGVAGFVVSIVGGICFVNRRREKNRERAPLLSGLVPV